MSNAPVNRSEITKQLAEVRVEHRAMDEAIQRMIEDPTVNAIALKRLKKRKLRLKDHIALLESRLIPDLDA